MVVESTPLASQDCCEDHMCNSLVNIGLFLFNESVVVRIIFLAKYASVFPLIFMYSFSPKESTWQKGQSYEDLWKAFDLLVHNGMFEAALALRSSILNSIY